MIPRIRRDDRKEHFERPERSPTRYFPTTVRAELLVMADFDGPTWHQRRSNGEHHTGTEYDGQRLDHCDR